MQITIPHKFQPRAYELPILQYFDSGGKRAVWVAHRRAGKDKTMWNLTIKKAHERKGTYYYFLPTYAQGRKIIWDGMDKDGFRFLDHIPSELIDGKPNESTMQIPLKCGSIIQIVGTDNYDSIVGTNPVGAVFSEYALQDPTAWQYIRPILLENGGWAAFIFTPRGKNHGYQILQVAKQNNWFHEILTVRDTKYDDGSSVITPEMIEQERREGMDEDLVQQEYFCSFNAALQGAYYGKYMQEMADSGRIGRALYDPILPVETWWDLGIGDSTAVLFTQSHGNEIRFIDYYESSGQGFEHYAKIVKEKPYTYDQHHFPHDASSRELGTGKSIKELAESLLGNNKVDIGLKLEIDFGIQAVRSILPRVWIDSEKCERLIDCLNSYAKEWDEKNKIWRDKPNHDWSSNGADAVRYFAVGYCKKLKPVESIYETRDRFAIF